MDYTQIRYEVESGIATVILNRPNKMNTVTELMGEELKKIFADADHDDAVRVIVVTGAGKTFCAGFDLSSRESPFDYRPEEGGGQANIQDFRDGGGQVVLAIYKCRKPVIAAINGHAAGFGITMTLPMDIRVAAQDAKIGFVFARRGIVMESCSSWFLPRIVGISKAAEFAYTGRVFLASEEIHSGLFNYVIPKEEVLHKAMAIANEISENTSAVSVALNKALLWHGLAEDDPQSVHLLDSRCVYWTGSREDAREGVKSFLERRAPKFTMRAWKDMPDFYPWWKEPKV
jgi:enoyl-CoA hydratase/carnithine racemase